jgi:hypothetical protein
MPALAPGGLLNAGYFSNAFLIFAWSVAVLSRGGIACVRIFSLSVWAEIGGLASSTHIASRAYLAVIGSAALQRP